jgi:predicted dehydrogenase
MANPKHRVLVVGGGSIGERHVRCFQKTRRALVELCEVNADVRDRVGSSYALEATYADLDSALAASPQLVVVCTPAHLHIPQALAAARAGCHLLIEKPLSTSSRGVDELVRAVAERGRVASLAYVYRAHPALIEMQTAVSRGEFGPPLHVTVQSGQHFPTYRPAYREIYYRDRATGGGAIQDALTHLVNAVEWLVGPITAVAADAAHLKLEGVDVEDTVNVVARHGGVLASYSLNQHQAPNESTITVVCRDATVRFEIHRHRWLVCRRPGEEWEERAAFCLERDDLFVRQADRMLDCIDQAQPPVCTLAEGLQTLRANLAILEASDSHRWISDISVS